MILTDTHCHLDLDKFDPDREAVIERANQAGVERILIPGLSVASSRSALKLALSHPKLFAAVGVHPTETATWNDTTRSELQALVSASYSASTPSDTSEISIPAGTSKVVAIGEIGLDYYWDTTFLDKKKTILREQLGLAAEVGLPVILHMREPKDAPGGACASDLLKLLGEWVAALNSNRDPLAERPGVLHSFSGTLETAREAIDLGFYIGVTGPVTFENVRQRQEIVAEIPLDRLLIETDAPFQAPHPHRGKRNEPAYVRLIADKIGYLHSRTTDTVAAATSENAYRLFNWKYTA